MDRPSAGPARGILHARRGHDSFVHSRLLPAPALRELVEHYWLVRWDLRGQEPHLAETLPHPSVHWVTERGRSDIRGVSTGRFSRRLEGKGRALGVKFLPGGFQPFLRAPVSTVTDDTMTLTRLFGGRDSRPLRAELRAFEDRLRRDEDDASDGARMTDLLERFLLARLPPPDPQVPKVTAIVLDIMADRDITKVEDVARKTGLHPRGLQRLFSHYVGVSPKWVIKRYRLHEALERMAADQRVDLARMAADLGYFDQTHFIKDFKALVGKTPAEYARSLTPNLAAPSPARADPRTPA